MVSLKFYGGIDEVGGNKILLEDKKNDARVFLDFGMSFSRRGMFFEEYLNPRVSSGLADLLALGITPNLKGIYRKDLLSLAGEELHDEPSIDAVILSHAHQDHASHISFLDERIPVYCSKITHAYLKAIQESGRSSFEQEIVKFKKRPSERSELPIERNFITTNDKVKINGLEIEMIPVDHSIFGGCGFIIHCSDKTIVYSGDVRLHGTHGDKTAEFARKAAEAKPDILLMEGTRIADGKVEESEAYVKTNAKRVAKETKGLVIADFAYKDLTRFATFLEAAGESERQLLIAFKDAYLIQALRELVPNLPKIDDSNLLLYKEKKRSGKGEESDYEKWERPFLSMKNTVDAAFVRQQQKRIVACLSYYDFTELVDIKPEVGSAYVHSLSEPYNEEMQIDKERLMNWLHHFNLPYLHFHCSGHAPGADLVKVANEIAPKELIPIHTEKPNLWRKLVKIPIKRKKREK